MSKTNLQLKGGIVPVFADCSPLQLGKIGEKNYKDLNFCQIRLEPPENENQKVPLAKRDLPPPNAPPK